MSIGAALTPGGFGIAMGAAAIGIDVLQGDPYGTGIGTGALFGIKGAGIIDIGYGVIQIF